MSEVVNAGIPWADAAHGQKCTVSRHAARRPTAAVLATRIILQFRS
jgi:hypothetical protein